MEALDVKIMGREFKIACKPEERSALLQAVNIVETKMSGIRNTGKIVGLDKIAVMAALQIAHESIVGTNSDKPTLALDIDSIERKIDSIGRIAEQSLVKNTEAKNAGLFD
ncbi:MULTISPECIES: cell division protein ZapA [Limnobacter]|uniref:Cell division protein ZapA n=1 Tax=Limnobacter litoralis TaxID=481366 RepID=A0ABQ5YW10_9BURK|nr:MULTISPECIES: cell division protein ZapA [Limnobacter]GLR26672.1 cell division protein ZapA [Limnobacter litoralis]HEX5487489.1 cell division protein ZapA [Limnobacter sp.]